MRIQNLYFPKGVALVEKRHSADPGIEPHERRWMGVDVRDGMSEAETYWQQ